MPVLGEIAAEPLLPKAVIFDLLGYEFYAPEVKAFHDSDAAIRIVTAPAGTSKSYATAPEIVYRALPHDPLLESLQWIIGINYDTNKEFQYVWKYFVDQRERWNTNNSKLRIEKAHNNPDNGDMVIVLDWGKNQYGRVRSVIEGKSSINERTLQGERISQVVFSEAAEHEARIWQHKISTRYWKAIFPTTPKQSGLWLKELSDQGALDPSLSIETFEFPPDANPLYDWERYAREEKMAASRSETGKAEDDPWFAEQFLGRWTMYTGRVLPIEKRNYATLDPKWLEVSKIFVSVDYGYEDACVALFWAVMPSGAMLIWDEIYSRHVLTHDFVKEIKDKLKPFEHRVAYVCGDPKQPQVARYMGEMGLSVINVDKRAQVDRAVGHRRLVDLLSVDPDKGHPMLFLDKKRCPKTVSEWKSLRYKEGFKNEYGSTALKGADHAFDAARYGVMTRPTPDEEPEPEHWLDKLERERREESWADRWRRTGISPYMRAA